jgi:hypothetical protein
MCVAVQKCFEMLSGQKVLIEKEGDVTIENKQQVETKLYSDHLTDGHKNLWNTLRNWLQPGFDETAYSSLILFTTQQFGKEATMKIWNDCGLEKRIALLTSIHGDFEDAYKTEQKKSNGKASPSAILLLQREVLDASARDKLRRILSKFEIEASSPTLPDLHQRIKDQYIKGILNGKKDDFLNALIGFITQPQGTKGQNWEITFDQFDKKVGDLKTLYCRDTRVFPGKFFQNQNALANGQIQNHLDHRFVVKIKEIEHHTVISEAIGDYLAAVQTLNEELAKYEIPPDRGTRYTDEILASFEKHYRIACRKCRNVLADSQVFFDERTVEPPRDFEGFSHTPIRFRNGILHMHMDDDIKTVQWKLIPNE